MIKDASELLKLFMVEEALKISKTKMPHMPTLGSAYEEITKKGIQQNFVIPPGLDLRVVSGFVKIGGESLPNQIDCMLVHGDGERYGLTNEYFYDIENVLVIFEVKKSLNITALEDAYVHLGALRKSFSEYFSAKMDRGEIRPDIRGASVNYSRITGEQGPISYDDIQYLDDKKKMLFYTMVIEQLSPVNIIHGYEGYSTESGLRNSLINSIDFKKKKVTTKKSKNKKVDLRPYAGVNGFPNLITSNDFSLIKTNGYPYFMAGGKKNVLTVMSSSRENPLRLMLEIIWTKISLRFDIEMPWKDDLTQEIITPLLFAEVLSDEEKIGWYYTSYEITEGKLKKIRKKEWEPYFISKNSMLIVRRISATNNGFKINDEEKEAVISFCNGSLDALCDELIKTTYFIVNDREIITTHRTTYILDDDNGGWVTTELDRLMQWKKSKGVGGAVIHTIIVD